jgi:glucose/arabinose dehydrogenase
MRKVVVSGVALALSACGGEDSGPTPSPDPTSITRQNNAPAFTSPTRVSAVENRTEAYRALATDTENDPVTITIAGGADAALFSLDVTGNLTFKSPPNFEDPKDANEDNIYEVTLSASDGRLSGAQDIRITVTNDREGIAVKRVGWGFDRPMQVHPDPDSSNHLFVAERAGSMYRLDLSTGEKTLLFTLQNVSTNGERGLIGFTMGRDGLGTATERLAFFVLATPLSGDVLLLSLAKDWDGYRATTILNVPHSEYSNHNGGWVSLEDGINGNRSAILVGIGDGGGAGDPNNNAQNPGSKLGKILRIPRSADPYAGAAPYYWDPATIYASGLRNPFRGTIHNGYIILGDVGESGREEINVLPTRNPSQNLGWPYQEGTLPYKGTPPANLTLTPPKLQYGHGSGWLQGRSVIGGVVYRGAIPSIKEHYLFGDFVSGHIWSVPFNRLLLGPLLDGSGYENRKADLTPDVGTIDQPVALGSDPDGSVYIVDYDGEIFKIVPSP